MDTPSTIDPNLAPAGYYAVPKPAWTPHTGNLCRQCDWRPTCNDPATDFSKPGHRCMNSNTVLPRKDGCSVLFKKKP